MRSPVRNMALFGRYLLPCNPPVTDSLMSRADAVRFPLFSLALFCLSALLYGCAHGGSQNSADAQFQKLSDEFVETHYAFRPISGAGLGWHKYDGQFVLPDRAAVAAERARLERFDRSFATVNADALSSQHRHDLHLLQSLVAASRFALEIQRAVRTQSDGLCGGQRRPASYRCELVYQTGFQTAAGPHPGYFCAASPRACFFGAGSVKPSSLFSPGLL